MTNGIADIDGIPADVLKAFSTRRAEIEERMAIRGQHSPKAAMIAALDTRRRKETDPGPTELRARWMERAEEMGFDPARLDDVVGVVGPIPLTDGERTAIEDHMLGADGLTAHDSSFNRNDILRAWCDAGNDLLYRELAYEALSRGRKTNRRRSPPSHSLPNRRPTSCWKPSRVRTKPP